MSKLTLINRERVYNCVIPQIVVTSQGSNIYTVEITNYPSNVIANIFIDKVGGSQLVPTSSGSNPVSSFPPGSNVYTIDFTNFVLSGALNSGDDLEFRVEVYNPECRVDLGYLNNMVSSAPVREVFQTKTQVPTGCVTYDCVKVRSSPDDDDYLKIYLMNCEGDKYDLTVTTDEINGGSTVFSKRLCAIAGSVISNGDVQIFADSCRI